MPIMRAEPAYRRVICIVRQERGFRPDHVRSRFLWYRPISFRAFADRFALPLVVESVLSCQMRMGGKPGLGRRAAHMLVREPNQRFPHQPLKGASAN